MNIKFGHIVKASSAFAFLALSALVAYIVVSQARIREEQKLIDAEIGKIKSEIMVRQCRLDRIYCCRRGDDVACARWNESGCRGEDGSAEIGCKAK